MKPGWTIVAAVAGILLSVQARINGQLTEDLGSPFVVTLLTFVVGATILVGVTVSQHRTLRPSKLLGDGWFGWWLLSGPFGAFLVLAIATGVPVLGVALVTVLTVVGQTVAGMAIDARGFGDEQVRLTRRRIASVVVAVLGLGITAFAVPAGESGMLILGLGLLLVAAGVASSMQQAGNGVITFMSGNPAVAGMFTFVTGGAVLVVSVAALWAAGRLGPISWPDASQWWLYTAGLFGTGFVVLTAWAVRKIGVLALALAVVAGQLLGALVLDATTGGPPLNLATGLSVAAVLVAVLLSMDKQAADTNPQAE